MTYESDQAGLLEMVAAEGDTLPVGERDRARRRPGGAEGDCAGTAAGAAAARGPRPGRGAPARPTAAARRRGRANRGSSDRAATRQRAGTARPQPTGEARRIKASPLARRIARESGRRPRGADAAAARAGGSCKADVQARARSGRPTAPRARRRGRRPRRSRRVATAKGADDERRAHPHCSRRSRGGWPSRRRRSPTSRCSRRRHGGVRRRCASS